MFFLEDKPTHTKFLKCICNTSTLRISHKEMVIKYTIEHVHLCSLQLYLSHENTGKDIDNPNLDKHILRQVVLNSHMFNLELRCNGNFDEISLEFLYTKCELLLISPKEKTRLERQKSQQ